MCQHERRFDGDDVQGPPAPAAACYRVHPLSLT